jgi:hypothetical protein
MRLFPLSVATLALAGAMSLPAAASARATPPLIESSEGLFLGGRRAPGTVVINEIMYNAPREPRDRAPLPTPPDVPAALAPGPSDAASWTTTTTATTPAPPARSPGDWVELMNVGAEPVDVTGWVFSGMRTRSKPRGAKRFPGGDAFEIPPARPAAASTEEARVPGVDGTSPPPRPGSSAGGGGDEKNKNKNVLPPGGCVVLARDAPRFRAARPDVPPDRVLDASFGFNLSPKGELLTLHDRSRALVDAVAYDDENGWPVEADGGGASLELADWRADRTDPFAWVASARRGGTPGEVNDAAREEIDAEGEQREEGDY